MIISGRKRRYPLRSEIRQGFRIWPQKYSNSGNFNVGNFKVAAIGDYDYVFASTSSSSKAVQHTSAEARIGTITLELGAREAWGVCSKRCCQPVTRRHRLSGGQHPHELVPRPKLWWPQSGFHRRFSPLQGRAVLQRGVILLGAASSSRRVATSRAATRVAPSAMTGLGRERLSPWYNVDCVFVCVCVCTLE